MMKDKKNSGFRKISIRTKLLILLIAVIVLLSAAMSAVMFTNMRDVLMGEAVNEMNLYCRERGMEIDTQLQRIEDSVSMVSKWFLQEIETSDSLDELVENKEYRDALLKQGESMLLLSAKRIEGAETIYFRYPLDLIDNSEEGVFFIRSSEGEFKQEPLTQVRDFAEDDMEHVGWYYLPIRRGKPMWMDPYHNDNINVTMISYVEPVYYGSTLIGLIGMDIDFSDLISEIDKIQYKETGYMYLKAADGSIHYHPEYLEGEDLHGDEEDDIISGDEEMKKEASENIIHYGFRGGDRVMVFMTLRNGMRLVLCDSYKEIFRKALDTLNYQLLVTAALFVMAVIALFLISNHITKPIRKLADAANQLSVGDFELEFPRETGDEVGELTRAFRTAVTHLKQYSDDMEALAYQDALTRVKNVAAFRIKQASLNEVIEQGSAEFGVVMLDLNYLKETNDRYGHSAGDIVLMRVASIVCRTFPLSPVYRVGGDEFTVVLEGAEYGCRTEKMSELEHRIRMSNDSAQEPYMHLSVAYGLAIFQKETDHSFDEVYRRADRKMYQMKHALHDKHDQKRAGAQNQKERPTT